ncbi:MAG: lysine--tRNA ligase [Candidatus Nitrosocaldus sp.]|nr:lysine--tRNA ligase [Candidatus Nitrosocaldus sp.]MDW8274959.1 lysine--tRNA ligase [Candidatus Nitrosocaldus sp.]
MEKGEHMHGIIGKGTWLDKVAHALVEREKRLGRDLSLIRVESGLGASGIPHIGSLGDAVRAYGVKLALEHMGYSAELVAYSDDMDGLRKVPHGLPAWLKDHIARPVCNIPDPFSCHSSYAMHMSSMLMDALDRLNVRYRFQSGYEAYRQGLLNREIDVLLRSARVIGEKIAELVGQEKFKHVLPYFPICSNCGRIYLAQAYEYLEHEHRVLYECRGGMIGREQVQGCGYRGEADVFKAEGKLSWKVEFAARWSALGIRFEAYGKDIMDSVKVNDWVSDNILNYAHPLHVRYEMFLDKSGRKISKSAGNVFTPQVWLRYGTPESLMLLLFKRIAGTRHVGVEDIPRLEDEYDRLEDTYFSTMNVVPAGTDAMKVVKQRGIYEYINHGRPPSRAGEHVPYMLLAQLASLAMEGREVEYVLNRLRAYGMLRSSDVSERFREKVIKARLYALEVLQQRSDSLRAMVLDERQKMAVEDLIQVIDGSDDAKVIQSSVFDTARKHGIEPKEFFRLLYMLLIGAEYGPRLGPYIIDVGRENVVSMLRRRIAAGGRDDAGKVSEAG